MTLNGVALILRYFTEFDRLRGQSRPVVEDRPIRFGAEYPLLLIFWLKLTQAAVTRSLRQLSLSFILIHYQFPTPVRSAADAIAIPHTE